MKPSDTGQQPISAKVPMTQGPAAVNRQEPGEAPQSSEGYQLTKAQQQTSDCPDGPLRGPASAAADARGEKPIVVVCDRCKFGCVVKVSLDSQGEILAVTGNTCDRGEESAHRRIESARLDGSLDKVIAGLATLGAPAAEASDKAATASEAPSMGYRRFRERHKRTREQSECNNS